MRALKAWINQQQVQVRRECCKRWLWLKQCITAELTPRALFTLWYCSIIAVSLQCCLIRLFTSVAAPCCWDNGIYTTQTDYRVIAIYTSAGRSCSATLDQERGHCHGTRYVVRQVSRRYIKAKIACGESCCSSRGYHCRLRLGLRTTVLAASRCGSPQNIRFFLSILLHVTRLSLLFCFCVLIKFLAWQQHSYT